MYKYWRYKPAKADRPYPFYARTHGRFDKQISAADGNKLVSAKT